MFESISKKLEEDLIGIVIQVNRKKVRGTLRIRHFWDESNVSLVYGTKVHLTIPKIQRRLENKILTVSQNL